MPDFLPGLELSRRFYTEVVRPLLAETFPTLPYAAALIGPGSEVLSFDTEMSRDHGWGLRLFLFLRDEDAQQANAISERLNYNLPSEFLGYPINLNTETGDPATQSLIHQLVKRPAEHRVFPVPLRAFSRIYLGYDLTTPLQATDWLSFSSQELRQITAGAVYYDGIGELTALRERLAEYPHDIWLYLLASGWQRIGQEEHLMPRAGYVGDELGSTIMASRLVRDIMNLCFLMEKQYAPYQKWFGTAFKTLQCAEYLWPLLWQAQQAATWQDRQTALAQAYEHLARMHNALAITPKLPETAVNFYDRPFRVIGGETFAQALTQQITDIEVKRIAGWRLIGNVNQWTDSTDLVGLDRLKLRQIYENPHP